MNNLLYSFIFLFALNINSQSSTVKVLDSLTLSSIPFATVYFSNNKGIITDIDGRFELINEQYGTNDSLFISSMGYKKTSLKISNFKDSIVYMIPEMITLENVVVTNRNLSSNEIIEKVIVNRRAIAAVDASIDERFVAAVWVVIIVKER